MPFDQTVGAMVVGSGSGTGDAKEFHQMFSNMGLELSLFRSEGGWDAELRNPIKQ